MTEGVWQVIIAAFVSNTIALGALGFLFKSIIEYYLNKNINSFKSDLEKEVTAYKSELDARNLRLQIAYGGIFEKQATFIIELYQSLAELELATYKTINYSGDAVEKWEIFRNAWAEVRKMYVHHRILLPEDVDQDLNVFLNKIFDSVLDYTNSDRGIMSPITTDDEFDKLKINQKAAIVVIEKEVPALKERLIQKIRKTISTGQITISAQG